MENIELRTNVLQLSPIKQESVIKLTIKRKVAYTFFLATHKTVVQENIFSYFFSFLFVITSQLTLSIRQLSSSE